jgi:electron transfer flavoprotein alpha subunit
VKRDATDYIVLVKQVPDISNIPSNAWNLEKGTLIRGMLDNVLNPLDLQALTFAYRMLGSHDRSRIICLTMGPPQAREVLVDCIARGADGAVLLTDRAFAGADTVATSYALAQAIRRIERDILKSRDYIVVTGMQSVDGDTAQVPPQIAEELGIEHIAYAQSFQWEGDQLLVKRIGPNGMETITPKECPLLITTPVWSEPLYRTFHRSRSALSQTLHEWTAQAIEAESDRIGAKGSRTQVYRIFSPSEARDHECQYPGTMDELADLVEKSYRSGPAVGTEKTEETYTIDGKTPTYRGEVWVYVELEDGQIKPVSLELLSEATKLAACLNEKVGAVLLGSGVEGLCKDLIASGADKVYVADHPLLKTFLPIPYKIAAVELVDKYRPQIMIFGATPLGRELAPRIAYRACAGLTADCTRLEIGDHKKGDLSLTAILKQTRPALGGNIMATIMTKESQTQMATVRPGVMKLRPPDSHRTGEIIRHTPKLKNDDLKTALIGVEEFSHKSLLPEAEIIVSGGRGLGSRANFDRYIEPLAAAFHQLLNGHTEVGATRMAVEEGFRDHSHQVGQTGQTVHPKLYVAVAISGAVQHVSGMQNSQIILAINKDPHARIFSHAHFGVVGDLESEVPKLIEAIERRVAKPSALAASGKGA